MLLEWLSNFSVSTKDLEVYTFTEECSTVWLTEDCSTCMSETRKDWLAKEEGGCGISVGSEVVVSSPSWSSSSPEDSFKAPGGGILLIFFPASLASGPSDSDEELDSSSSLGCLSLSPSSVITSYSSSRIKDYGLLDPTLDSES